jgi:hypothetical protein
MCVDEMSKFLDNVSASEKRLVVSIIIVVVVTDM